MGYKLKLFAGSVDETALRSLQLLCNQSVTLLDPVLCGERENFRWLFQCVASPECINLVITNLGARWTKDSPFRIPRECLLLCEWLDCEMIPVVYRKVIADGAIVNTPDKAPFIALALPIQDALAERLGLQDTLAKIREEAK